MNRTGTEQLHLGLHVGEHDLAVRDEVGDHRHAPQRKPGWRHSLRRPTVISDGHIVTRMSPIAQFHPRRRYHRPGRDQRCDTQ